MTNLCYLRCNSYYHLCDIGQVALHTPRYNIMREVTVDEQTIQARSGIGVLT